MVGLRLSSGFRATAVKVSGFPVSLPWFMVGLGVRASGSQLRVYVEGFFVVVVGVRVWVRGGVPGKEFGARTLSADAYIHLVIAKFV